MNFQNNVTFSLSRGTSTFRFVPAVIILDWMFCSDGNAFMRHIIYQPWQPRRQMCVSSLSCFAVFKRTVRGATLHILVPSQTLWLHPANETLCFQPSARTAAEAEEPVCLQTPVSVPQDSLDPAVRQVNWKLTCCSTLVVFCRSHSTFLLCRLILYV